MTATPTASARSVPAAHNRPGYELTLIAADVIDDLTAQVSAHDFTSTRRNILTQGINLHDLVGRDFTIGDVRCRGLGLAEPCVHLERIEEPGLLRPLINRGGLRADILIDGHVAERQRDTHLLMATSRSDDEERARPADTTPGSFARARRSDAA